MDVRYFLFVSFLGLAACGGGGGSSSTPVPVDSGTTTPAAPTVQSTTPAAGDSDVIRQPLQVDITFSKAMDEATFDGAFTLTDGVTDFLPTSYSLSADDLTASFVFEGVMPRDTVLTANLLATVAAADGAELGAAESWDFTTAPEFLVRDAESQVHLAPDLLAYHALSDDRVLVVEQVINDPTVLSATIVDRAAGTATEYELKSISAGATPYWQFTDAAEASNGDIAIAVLLTNTSGAYTSVLGPGERNRDAYAFYYDADADAWSEKVLLESSALHASIQEVYFNNQDRLMAISHRASTSGTVDQPRWYGRDLAGSWTYGDLTHWPLSHSSTVDIGVRLWTLDTVNEMDSDGVMKQRLYAYGVDFDAPSEATPVLLTSSQPGDVIHSEIAGRVGDVIYAGATMNSSGGKVYEGITLEMSSALVSVTSRVTSGEIDAAFTPAGFDILGTDFSWLLTRNDANGNDGDPHLLWHSEAGGWEPLYELAPENDSVARDFTTDWMLQGLDEVAAVTWQNCDYTAAPDGFSCITRLVQFDKEAGVAGPVDIMNDFDSNQSSSDLQWIPYDETVVFYTTPDLATWNWVDLD
ncbi:MAG: Ig-like domain-containing protein [Gammaproteobacteria bacterium]|nr:Ig-like domain-containing protein [Gammaproteobacteria bacterium]